MKFTRLHKLQKEKVPRTLKRSFLIITVALMITFGIGAAVISYVIFSDSLRSNAIHSAETNLQFMRNDIDSNLDSIMELALWSRTNTSVINYISSDPEGSAFNALTREAGERLSEEYLGNSANPYISRIIITNSNNTKYLQRYLQAYYSVDLSVIERIKGLPYFDELISAPDYIHFPSACRRILSPAVRRKKCCRSSVRSNPRTAATRSDFCTYRFLLICLRIR